ncbi:uncharacterized protein LOC125855803 [Solanum stenotomum]|uniref:uncharacterized protein LOC125855803 n=1 Tax=Solanum stenotomum TaxID=172797 RepID=UPI0020D061AF|nr:uncharacterized protein LOC125855803 [Solanum stenotomum]
MLNHKSKSYPMHMKFNRKAKSPMMSQAVTNQVGQQRGAQQEEADTSRIHEFLRMNRLSFTGSSTTEDPENFSEELKKVFEVIHIADTELVELAGRAEDAPPASWVCFEEVFLGRFFPRELKEAKGSVAQGGSKPSACAECGRNHSECPKNKQGNGNGGNRAQYSSVAPPNRAAPKGATFGTGGGTNRLYSINNRQELEDSPDVVTVSRNPLNQQQGCHRSALINNRNHQ